MICDTWRDRAKIRIADVIEEVGNKDKIKLKKALFDAYPFGLRKHFPYKMWCEEVRMILNPELRPTKKNQVTPLKPEEVNKDQTTFDF